MLNLINKLGGEVSFSLETFSLDRVLHLLRSMYVLGTKVIIGLCSFEYSRPSPRWNWKVMFFENSDLPKVCLKSKQY